MTTRDPRDPRSARVGRNEAAQARDPTAPLSIDVDPREHPSLATGTGDERTKVESPNARQPKPERAATRPPPIPRNFDDPDFRLGAVLGTYRLAELLGKGGMGYVYRAEHVKLGREVALKLLRADYARRRESVNRFFQEAKTVNRVRHRNIVDVTDFVELPDGTTFIIMELLQGQSLGKWARTGIDLPRALAVLVQICDGLGAAHAVGVIHRDLKPDNVIVTATADGGELVKLLDFGVAKLVNRDDEDVGFQTAAGSVIGTPAYMSPEQAGGMAIDQRSDIYSLGAIMYELFCGQPLFRGRSFGEYVRKHLTEAPIPPRQTEGGANMHERLEALILRCLEKEPDRRFGHILELRDGVLQLLGEPYAHPSGARPVVAAPLPTSQLPLVPPMQTTMPTPAHPSHHSQPMYVHATASQQQLAYSQQYGYQHRSGIAQRPLLWPWIAGGVIAVGLGITSAVWYSGRGPTVAPVSPAPATPVVTMRAEPIEAPPKPPSTIELRFDSVPSGGVYEAGRSVELCRTPCSFNVDPNDGGSRRAFFVRSEGYVDKQVDVDLLSTEREFKLTLDRVAERPIVKAVAATKRVAKPAAKPDDTTLEKPTATTPAPQEPIIDPTDTHDPFKHH
ncbi:MAG TPA: protein kinase [Kofleriaceae bacterium]|nr:protein kinase [Kofleriaceae bacterium]